jgi:hypothetical protein
MTDKTPESQKRASQTYRDKMLRDGYRPVHVWVPSEKVEQAREYARKLREERG